MRSFSIEWDQDDLTGGVRMAFDYLERQDEIVGGVYTNPKLMKRLILEMPDEVDFQYIPEGIGMIRTAYLKFSPSVKNNEIQFVNQEETKELRLFLR